MPLYVVTRAFSLDLAGGQTQLVLPGSVYDDTDYRRFNLQGFEADGALLREGQDATPWATDWDDLGDLYDDLASYAREHRGDRFDMEVDTGEGVRILRVIWLALGLDDAGLERVNREWTIPTSRYIEASRKYFSYHKAHLTAGEHLRWLVGDARADKRSEAEVYRPTVWERLDA